MPRASLPELLADLRRAYPDARLDDGTLRLYLRDLDDLPLEPLERALVEWRRSEDWFPKLGQIRAAVAEIVLDLPSEADALAQVEARVAWARGRNGAPPPVHVLVKGALDLVGGFPAWKAADSPAVIRGQFLRLFRDARARTVRDAQVGRTALGPAPERKEIKR